AREYDPTLGRWLSRDAARWGGGLNFYVYAGDDPVNLIDPDGRTARGAAIGAAIGFGFGGGIGGAIGAALGDFFTGRDPKPDPGFDGGICGGGPPDPPPPPDNEPQGCNCMCANGTRYKASSLAKCLKYCAPFGGQCM
ncbi:MAG: RHS repeat-associated core domain-containing protein, partial [Polyangiaceae bacterium]